MRILILGGTAFTGPHIARALVEAGHAVSVFHRPPDDPSNAADLASPRRFLQGAGHPEPLPGAVTHLHGDRRRLHDSADTLRAVRPDVVIDMLALSRRDAEGLMETFRHHAGRLIVASSQDVYRAFGFIHGHEREHTPTSAPLSETSPLRTSHFLQGQPEGADEAYEKLFVEETVAGDSVLPATILRMPATYGPNDPLGRVRQFLDPMDRKRPYVLLHPDFATWRWTHAYVENVAHAFVLAATRAEAAGENYNIGEPPPPARAPTMGEWAHQIARLAGYRGRILALPRDRVPPHLQLPGLDLRQDMVASTQKIREHLGYAEPVSPEEALRRTIAWDRAHPAPAHPPRDDAAEDALLRDLGL